MGLPQSFELDKSVLQRPTDYYYRERDLLRAGPSRPEAGSVHGFLPEVVAGRYRGRV